MKLLKDCVFTPLEFGDTPTIEDLQNLHYTEEYGRGTKWFATASNVDYAYGTANNIKSHIGDTRLPDWLIRLIWQVRVASKPFLAKAPKGFVPFNHILVNRYLPGQMLKHHKDNEECLTGPIASLSVGGEAQFGFGLSYHCKERVTLKSGDLWMGNSYFFNNYWHTALKPTATRYNLTFRTVSV